MAKRAFTLVNLILLTALIWVGVDTFYQLVAARLAHGPVPDSRSAVTASFGGRRNQPFSHFKPVTERDLFKTKEEVAAPPDPEPEPAVTELEPTKLKIRLWGTVTGTRNTETYAVIEDMQKRNQDLYHVGDAIQGATVDKILRKKVILSVNGKREVLEMEETLASAAPSLPSAPANFPGSKARAAAPAGPSREIRLSRNEVQQAMSDVNSLMRQARIRPHFRNGKPDGLTFTRVRRNSLFTKLGIRSGDIITGVNGKPIRSVDDALKFYQNLKSTSNVNVQIRRRGREQTLEYNID